MDIVDRINFISNWIGDYAIKSSTKPFNLVVGVSGGIDSAVTSTLCAKTNLKTIVVSMPIKQNVAQHSLSLDHIEWLKSNFTNVESYIINLDNVFKIFQDDMKNFPSDLAFANSRSRLRMVTLYQIAQSSNSLVVGTGNKVEDFGIGFYTKYGDGGVDISPIADCKKTQVWELGKHLRVSQKIIDAEPTDGLWNDGRNDADQLGMTYAELENAMENKSDLNHQKYLEIRKKNLHKMEPIPVCKFNES
jgi:NAD+ synthase